MNRIEFMALMYGMFNEQEVRDIELAYLLSKKFHKGQFRKELGPDGKPLRYFEHPRRVGLSIFQEAGIRDANTIISGLCHDVIEDPEETQLIATLLLRLFHPEVSETVRILSKTPKAGYLDRFRAEVERFARDRREPKFLIVKMADRLDNLRSLPTDNPAFVDKQIRETREEYLPIFSKWYQVFHDLSFREGAQDLYAKIDAIVDAHK